MDKLLRIAIASMCGIAMAQSSIEWHSLDGGAGTSTGGTYAVSGTIGQPDAGSPHSGGDYILQGGFWSYTVIQIPGGPRLYIAPAGPEMIQLYWDNAEMGFTLQESPDLAPTNWVNAVTGTNNPAILPAAEGHRFFRLWK